MKGMFKDWNNFLIKEEMSEYVHNGVVTMYHYSRNVDADSIMLDPEFFKDKRNSWSRREYNTSSFPRVFFYLDTSKTERDIANGAPFSVDVPVSDIYNLRADEEGLLEKSKKASGQVVPDLHKVLKALAGKDFPTRGYEEHHKPIRGEDAKIYKGVHYAINYGETPVVAWFEDIEVTREKSSEEREDI